MLRAPDASSNKYSRGKVLVIGGAMPGAAHLCAQAAMRSGAGYVELATEHPAAQPPYALVQRGWAPELLADDRIGAVAIGPGLADDDGLQMLGRIHVLTPHEGEFATLFGPICTDRLNAVRDAAQASGAYVLLKGSETIIATPKRQAIVMPPASPWLSTAGTGDVLTGVIATMLAQAQWHGFDTLEAIRAACWFHARAAELAGPALIADDLLWSLKRAVAKA